jgi:hypothetical protein
VNEICAVVRHLKHGHYESLFPQSPLCRLHGWRTASLVASEACLKVAHESSLMLPTTTSTKTARHRPDPRQARQSVTSEKFTASGRGRPIAGWRSAACPAATRVTPSWLSSVCSDDSICCNRYVSIYGSAISRAAELPQRCGRPGRANGARRCIVENRRFNNVYIHQLALASAPLRTIGATWSGKTPGSTGRLHSDHCSCGTSRGSCFGRWSDCRELHIVEVHSGDQSFLINRIFKSPARRSGGRGFARSAR